MASTLSFLLQNFSSGTAFLMVSGCFPVSSLVPDCWTWFNPLEGFIQCVMSLNTMYSRWIPPENMAPNRPFPIGDYLGDILRICSLLVFSGLRLTWSATGSF